MEDLELTFSAGLTGKTVWEQFCNLDDSLDYCRSHKVLKAVHFPHNPVVRYMAHAARSMAKEANSPLLRSVRWAAAQKVVQRFLNPLAEQALRQANIFHSPSFAFPELTASIGGLRRFLTVHDMIPVLYPHFFDQGAEARHKAILRSLRPSDWVLCDSESTRNDLCEYVRALDRARVFVTWLAADPDIFYRCTDEQRLAVARRSYNIPDRPYVLSVCAIEPRKNLDHVVRCFTDLVRQQKIDDLNLVLVGPPGWKNQAVLDQIRKSGEVRSRIIVTGYVRNEDMAAIYSGALMFVYPSLYEGFGLPLLEAMQCGLPAITSNTSSLPEVVGNAGALVDPRDDNQLCAAMLELYRSPVRRAALAEAALERAQQFSWQRCLSQTLEAYKTALCN